MTTRSRPCRLARYRWASARASSSAGEGSGGSPVEAAPMLTVTGEGAGRARPGVGRDGPAQVVQQPGRRRRRAADRGRAGTPRRPSGRRRTRRPHRARSAVPQQLGDGAQHPVADLVGAGVVDPLEVVEVEEGDGDGLGGGAGPLEQPGELLVDEAPVVEPGERVAQRQLPVAAGLPARLGGLVHGLQRAGAGVPLARTGGPSTSCAVPLVLLERRAEVAAAGVQLRLLPAGAHADRGEPVLVAPADALVEGLLRGVERSRAGAGSRRGSAGSPRRRRRPGTPRAPPGAGPGSIAASASSSRSEAHQRPADRVQPADVAGGRRARRPASCSCVLQTSASSKAPTSVSQ